MESVPEAGAPLARARVFYIAYATHLKSVSQPWAVAEGFGGDDPGGKVRVRPNPFAGHRVRRPRRYSATPSKRDSARGTGMNRSSAKRSIGIHATVAALFALK